MKKSFIPHTSGGKKFELVDLCRVFGLFFQHGSLGKSHVQPVTVSFMLNLAHSWRS